MKSEDLIFGTEEEILEHLSEVEKDENFVSNSGIPSFEEQINARASWKHDKIKKPHPFAMLCYLYKEDETRHHIKTVNVFIRNNEYSLHTLSGFVDE